MKLSKDEQAVLSSWRAKNEAAWEEDISAARRVAADPDTSQGNVAEWRAQVEEMLELQKSGADHSKHKHEFGYPRHKCICDQQRTHPNCRRCA